MRSEYNRLNCEMIYVVWIGSMWVRTYMNLFIKPIYVCIPNLHQTFR